MKDATVVVLAGGSAQGVANLAKGCQVSSHQEFGTSSLLSLLIRCLAPVATRPRRGWKARLPSPGRGEA